MRVELTAEELERLAARVSEILAEQQPQPDPSPWLSAAEAAGYLRISERQLHRLVAQDRVQSATVGRRRVFHRDQLDKVGSGGGEAPTTPPRRRGVD
jgi:excisionase family DNA binding protein